MFLLSWHCGAEQLSQQAAIKPPLLQPTLKNLSGDWLMVTAVSSVIGQVLIASVWQCGVDSVQLYSGHGRVQMCIISL